MNMKMLVLLSCLIATSVAQRGSFAGLSPKGIPEVASRFRGASAQSALASPSGTDPNIVSRLGQDQNTNTNTPSNKNTNVNVPQRGSFAGLGYKGIPEVASRFKGASDQSALAAPSGADLNLANRLGQDQNTNTNAPSNTNTNVKSVTLAQRGSFAGAGPIGVPELASRFKPTSGADSSTGTGINLANRVGEDDSTSTSFDEKLVNRYNDWPRENRPFSVLNAQHIQNQINPNGQQKGQAVNGDTLVETPSRGSFSSTQPQISNRNNVNLGQGGIKVVKNGEQHELQAWKTYIYDPVSDAWYPKKATRT